MDPAATQVPSTGQTPSPPAVGSLMQEVVKDVEVSPEVERVGVTVTRESIELPPDVKKLGVTPAGSSVPVATSATIPPVVLPISDQQVVTGLHAQIISSLRWLAVWCLKKLQKAHIMLKVIHGKIIRVKD
ncbi:hypothetical protein HZB96_02500 [Candidatus Gottesmanbacteria bacterium]|nr:hypothetical protein [Candidatus Gottesmanbacteria bacterium]